MNRHWIGLGVSALIGVIAVTGAVVTSATAGSTGKQAPPRPPVAPMGAKAKQLAGVNFVTACRFSHRNMDDPIIFPGGVGRSHEHTFFGNTTTSASSTLATLLAGSTTCQRKGDTAGYWVPTLIAGGQAVEPRAATIYYRRKTTAAVQPFPAGLKVVAGNSKATSAQDTQVTFWNCGVQGGVKRSATIPTCPNGRGEALRLHVNFPNCWDGKSTDSADHQSHMAYSTRGVCPSSHPVAVPAISLIVQYRTAVPANAVLTSGGQFSGHGDFFNAWNQNELTALVANCLNALRHCVRGV